MILRTVRRFNADIMKPYISTLGHARKLKFTSYFHLTSISQIYQYRHV